MYKMSIITNIIFIVLTILLAVITKVPILVIALVIETIKLANTIFNKKLN